MVLFFIMVCSSDTDLFKLELQQFLVGKCSGRSRTCRKASICERVTDKYCLSFTVTLSALHFDFC